MAHNVKRDYGLRACAGLSMLSAFSMIFLSMYVFLARVGDLETCKFPSAHATVNISKPYHYQYHNNDNSDDDDYGNTLKQLNKLWIKNRPVLASGSMLAILAGLLQLNFSGLVILSDSKAMQLYVRKWILIHFILVIVLFIILLNTVVLTENTADDNDKESWDELTTKLMKYLKGKRSNNDYDELFRCLGAGQNLIYIGVSVNLIFILTVMGATLYLMRNQQGDYESYE